MNLPQRKDGLRVFYNQREDEIKLFFKDLSNLLDNGFDLQISLAYVFFKIEQAQHQILFCGARKQHRTESLLTWEAIDSCHMTRNNFKTLFNTIMGFNIPDEVQEYITNAEKTRDRLMHGKKVNNKELTEAIAEALLYSEKLNELIASKPTCSFKPFGGDLRGFCGRLEPLDKSTTRWILKGMGFKIS